MFVGCERYMPTTITTLLINLYIKNVVENRLIFVNTLKIKSDTKRIQLCETGMKFSEDYYKAPDG